jgi:polar amino acid transport system substrate-binding protein
VVIVISRARCALVRTATLVALAGLIAACGSAGTASQGTQAAAGAATHQAAAAAASYPAQDVVSQVAADPKLTAELPASVRASGTFILGTTFQPGTAGLPHAGVASGGQPIGLDVDLRDAVAKVLGIKWDVQYGTFATIIPGVQNGRYAVGMDNFGVTKAREQVVDFATYLSDGQSFLAPSGSPLSSVTSITDLCGLTIATGAGTTFQAILTKDAANCSAAGKKPYQVQYFADSAPIWLGLANGKIDIYFGPTLSLKYDVTHVPNVKFLGQFSSTPVGLVTAKGSPLAKPLSDAINELIATGEYARILGKWGVASSGITRSVVNPVPGF